MLPDLAPILVPLYKGVFATGEPVLDYEIIGQTPKEPGVDRVWMGSYFPVSDAGGRTDYVAAVVQEVTAARKMEFVERQNAKRLRRLLDGIGSLVGVLDTSGTLLEANQTALGIAGLAPEDVLGKPFEQTYWWSYSHTVQAQLRDAIERARLGESVRYDVLVRVRDGQFITIDFQLTPLRDDDGRVINLMPSAVDVTERKAAEAALATSEALFRETFEQTAVGMAHISLDGRWLRVNDRLSEIFGFTGDDLQNRTFQEITCPQDVDAEVDNMRRLIAGEIDSYSMEKRCVGPSGSLTWVNSTVSVQRDAVGEPDHVIVVVEDIDARKAAEQRLATVMSELSHRVKNLLATMQTVVTHAARRAESKEQLVQSVTTRTRALANTHDILIKSQWQGAEISELVAEEVRPYGAQRVHTEGSALWLTPKAALAFCLLMHELATNAAKYGALSGETGRVDVRWTVTDTGEGETFRFVWEEHGGPAVTPPSARGFGSEIIEDIAPRELDGVSTLEFLPEGVRLTMEAPLQRMATGEELARNAERRRSARAPAGDGAQRVLVVEDSAMIAMDLESFLTSAGYKVIGPASSVSEAMALVDGDTLDAAFLDVDVEGELVTPVAIRLKDMGVPFAFLTGFDGASIEVQEFHDVIVLEKPFSDRLILTTLATLLANRQAAPRP
ncbi:MAG: PAS domain S-box protein [Rhodospirillales bacterium]|nr:PAS domain S-box protein [Rhodospirillales bacterium]